MKKDEQPKGANRREFLTTSAGMAVAGMLGNFGASKAMRIPFPSAPGVPRRIILDTDPGIDDAMAIFLALRSPELKVEAITPVSGNVPLELTLPNEIGRAHV